LNNSNHFNSPQYLHKVSLDFEENNLLSSLFGQHDENLSRVEQVLGVEAVSRGNRVVIVGVKEPCEVAANTLRALYNRLKTGLLVELGDVDGAIRFAANKVKLEVGTYSSSQKEAMQSLGEQKIITRNRTITPRTLPQAEYISQIKSHEMTFGVGPAGTGKTYLAVAIAVSKLIIGEVDRIILTRPAVEAGENLGFLPGDLKEKVDPYLQPLYDALYDMLPVEQVEKKFENGQIEIAPLAFMRGRTLSNAFVILDEAQNTTALQMKMFLTRFGENSRMVIAGDPSQVDLPRGQGSGLKHVIDIIGDVEGVSITYFTHKDVVRHPLVGRIVSTYENNTSKSGSKSEGP
jgi:phosphate starvation-inducible PhoH-like protein